MGGWCGTIRITPYNHGLFQAGWRGYRQDGLLRSWWNRSTIHEVASNRWGISQPCWYPSLRFEPWKCVPSLAKKRNKEEGSRTTWLIVTRLHNNLAQLTPVRQALTPSCSATGFTRKGLAGEEEAGRHRLPPFELVPYFNNHQEYKVGLHSGLINK